MERDQGRILLWRTLSTTQPMPVGEMLVREIAMPAFASVPPRPVSLFAYFREICARLPRCARADPLSWRQTRRSWCACHLPQYSLSQAAW